MNRKALSVGAFVCVLLLVPLLITHRYYVHLTNLILIYTLACTGLNLTTGYTGQLSLGHAAFFAVGAYSSALLTMKLHVPFLLALLLAALLATAFGALLGLPSLRLRGPYLALATAGFGEIVVIIINNAENLTHGSKGITGIPAPEILGLTIASGRAWSYLLIVLFLLCTGATYRLLRSHFGRAWVAIRENEPSALAAGINSMTLKVMAFALGAFLAGIAGSLYAHFVGYISPDSFTFGASVSFLSMVVVGGKGHLWGPLIGSAALVLVPDFLSFLQDFKMVFHGILLVISMMFLPGGLASLESVWHRLVQHLSRSRREPA